MEFASLLGLIILAVVPVTLAINHVEKKKRLARIQSEWQRGKISGRTYDTESSLEESLANDRLHLDPDYIVDHQTWLDLDLQTLFEEMNIAYSSLGAEYLYTKLHYLKEDPLEQEFRDFQAYFADHPDDRLKVQHLFYQLGKQNQNGIKSPQVDIPYSRTMLLLHLFQGLLPIAALGLIFFDSHLGMMVVGLILSVNIVTFLVKKSRLDQEMSRYHYLVRVLGTAHSLSKMELPHADFFRQMVAQYKGILIFRGFLIQRSSSSEMDIIYDYLNGIFMVPFIAYQFFLKGLKAGYNDLLKLYRLLSAMEAGISVLRYLESLEYYTRPDLTEKEGCFGSDVYHPLVSHAVANPISFDQNLLIVGDNASGKSTYIKMVALNLILAQTLNMACARSFSLRPGPVYTSLNLADQLLDNQSYFMSECQSVKRMLDALEGNRFAYIFLDELFKGTNTKDRLSIALSLVEWLSSQDVRYLVSTHDIELLDMTQDYNKIYHFQSTYQDGHLSFDYRLREGAFRKTNAIEVLEDFGFPREMIDKSREHAKAFRQLELPVS